jgi:hypothetical protein
MAASRGVDDADDPLAALSDDLDGLRVDEAEEVPGGSWKADRVAAT